MNSEQFEQLVAKSKTKAVARSIARAVLVDGRSYTEAARAFGRGRQFAYQACRRLLEKQKEADQVYMYSADAARFCAVASIVRKNGGRDMLTGPQFDVLLVKSRQYPRSVTLARSVLVEGHEIMEVAKRYAVSRHLVWKACNRLMKRFDPSAESIRVFKGPAAMFVEIDRILQISAEQ